MKDWRKKEFNQPKNFSTFKERTLYMSMLHVSNEMMNFPWLKKSSQLNKIYTQAMNHSDAWAVSVTASVLGDVPNFFAKYSTARAWCFATDGFTHFLGPGTIVRVQPPASSLLLAESEKAPALMESLALSSPSPRI